MKKSDIGLIYGMSFAGVATFLYFTGKRGTELWKQSVVCTALSGTGIVVLGIVGENYKPGTLATPNEATGLGKLTKKGVAVIEAIDTQTLYADMNSKGVKVAPVPDNPNMVRQDAS